MSEHLTRAYRKDFWNQQPIRVEAWSEKGTVRGVLQPVPDEYAVGFRVMHGFASATVVHDIAEDNGRSLIALYVGDYDPSGLFMSEEDLPKRLAKYEGDHVRLRRIALLQKQTTGLQSFSAREKKKDKRYSWFVRNYGKKCWELDAMDPRVLRNCVEREIKKLIEPEAWRRCEIVNAAEKESIKSIISMWGGAA